MQPRKCRLSRGISRAGGHDGSTAPTRISTRPSAESTSPRVNAMISSSRAGRHLFRLVSAIAIAVVGGCSPIRRGPAQPPAYLVFANSSLAQADVFIVSPGFGRRRVGTVMSGQTDTLQVPTDITTRGGTVNIVARLLARNEVPQTGPVSIFPGETYDVRLSMDGRLISFLPGRS